MTTQNNNEFLEGESNSRENFENKWNYPSEIKKGINYPAYEEFTSKVYIEDEVHNIKWRAFKEFNKNMFFNDTNRNMDK